MSMDGKISKLCGGLKLTNEEKHMVNVLKENIELSFEKSRKCLVAFIVSNKEVN